MKSIAQAARAIRFIIDALRMADDERRTENAQVNTRLFQDVL
jgi:hypothetical protein